MLSTILIVNIYRLIFSKKKNVFNYLGCVLYFIVTPGSFKFFANRDPGKKLIIENEIIF